MLKIGIVGLPNSGKSTLFNALLQQPVARVADYPFTTIEPNVGVVEVPDERLAQIGKLIANSKSDLPAEASLALHSLGEAGAQAGIRNSKQTQNSNFQNIKIIPATIEFVDIAGLVKDAHQGKGLGNQFLSHIREVDALVQVVRSFDPEIPPDEAIKIINDELKAARIEKPTLIVQNVADSHIDPRDKAVVVNAKTGEGLDQLIVNAYKLLNLITFYTLKPDQVQAWPIKQGSNAYDAAGKIHTDFQKGFIKAEVVNFDDFVAYGGWQQAKLAGKVHLEGKDYLIHNGDVVLYRFNV